MKLKVALKSGINVRIKSDSDWVIYNEIFVLGEYNEIYKYLNLKATNIIVLDLGANVGYFSLNLADYFISNEVNNFKIIAVEANTKNYKACQERLCSELNSEQITIKQGLVGKVNGVASFQTEFHHFGHSVINGHVGEKKHEILSYIDLNEFLNQDETITLIKCDIEGSEKDFITEYSSLLSRTELFICEFHYDIEHLNKLRKLLMQYGFNYSKVVKTDSKYNTTVELFVK